MNFDPYVLSVSGTRVPRKITTPTPPPCLFLCVFFTVETYDTTGNFIPPYYITLTHRCKHTGSFRKDSSAVHTTQDLLSVLGQYCLNLFPYGRLPCHPCCWDSTLVPTTYSLSFFRSHRPRTTHSPLPYVVLQPFYLFPTYRWN